MVRGRWSPADLERIVISTAARDDSTCRIRIPQDPGAGSFVAAYMRGQILHSGGYTVTIEPERASKAQRAAPVAARA